MVIAVALSLVMWTVHGSPDCGCEQHSFVLLQHVWRLLTAQDGVWHCLTDVGVPVGCVTLALQHGDSLLLLGMGQGFHVALIRLA
jgi:hypothetical protein